MPKGTALSIRKRTLKAEKGKVRGRVSCPKSASGSCKRTLRLGSGNRTLGSKRHTVAAGKAKTVTVTLKQSARKLLSRKKRKRMRVTISATSTDASGVVRRSSRRVTLRRAR